MAQSNNQHRAVIQDGDGNRISKVVVFFDRALITRSAEVEAAAGINHFEIAVGAVQLDQNSVTAQILGKGQIIGVRYRAGETQQVSLTFFVKFPKDQRPIGL